MSKKGLLVPVNPFLFIECAEFVVQLAQRIKTDQGRSGNLMSGDDGIN
jgi:hypothetical protein